MKVVVDASNVAYSTKNENSQPQMSNILAAVKSLEESGDEFVIIAVTKCICKEDNPFCL